MSAKYFAAQILSLSLYIVYIVDSVNDDEWLNF